MTSQRCTYFLDIDDEICERVGELSAVEQVEVHQVTSGEIWTADRMAETERRARELLERARKAGLLSGKSPVGLAAAAVYAAGTLTGEDVTQAEVAAVTDMSEVTIRNRYQELLEAEGEATPA